MNTKIYKSDFTIICTLSNVFNIYVHVNIIINMKKQADF